MRRPALVAGTLVALLSLAACGRPPAAVATGEVYVTDEADFELIVPEGWRAAPAAGGVTLTRETQYGGGFPTLNVRRVTAAEIDALRLSGVTVKSAGRTIEYRYQAWKNSRGRGWRLEALIRAEESASGGGALFAEASVWDDEPALNRAVFEDWFWPVLNSIRER